jgi:hypothetical protein
VPVKNSTSILQVSKFARLGVWIFQVRIAQFCVNETPKRTSFWTVKNASGTVESQPKLEGYIIMTGPLR